MDRNNFIESLMSKLESVPDKAEVFELKTPDIDVLHRRGQQLMSGIADHSSCNVERGDWISHSDSTFVRLPRGASAVFFHASGAMQLNTGLAPMEALFDKMQQDEQLRKIVQGVAKKLNIRQWVSETEELRFERLWKIKACAADRDGNATEPVLCRAVGAYRHYINDLPVLGAASVAVSIANEGQLDSLSVMARQNSGKVIDSVKPISPEQAADKVLQRLQRQMGNNKLSMEHVEVTQPMQFGYLSLGKRKAQHILEPAYVVSLSINGQEDAQGYMFAIEGTDSPYMPLTIKGEEALAVPSTTKLRYSSMLREIPENMMTAH